MKKTEHSSPFRREIENIGKQLEKLKTSMESITQRLDCGDVQGAYEAAFDFAEAAESLTCAARQLPAYTGHPQANKAIERHIVDSFPVKIGFTAEGWFGISMPALLPKKNKGSTEYISDNLSLALKHFWRGKEPIRYTDCFIVFRHVYRRDRPERHYRDHDNIELKAAIDAIAIHVLYDDSALQCSHLYVSKAGDENRTEIFVLPKDEIGVWIRNAKSYDGRGVILYESCP